MHTLKSVFHLEHARFLVPFTLVILSLCHSVILSQVCLAETWKPFGIASSSVENFSVYNGELIAIGGFSSIDGTRVNRIARYDGTRWNSMAGGIDGPAEALAVYQGDLYAGGVFLRAGDQNVFYIARWNGSTWSAVAEGTNSAVRTLISYTPPGGPPVLIAGGEFSRAGSVDVKFIAQWNNSFWRPLGTGLDGKVFALGVFRGELIAAGKFTVAGGVAASNIARWNGSVWSPLGNGLDDAVYGLTEYNGELYATGDFQTAGNSPARSIARWNGQRWSPVGAGLTDKGRCLTVFEGKLVCGGNFRGIGDQYLRRVAAWDGETWTPLGRGLNNWVEGLTVWNNHLVAGGWFNQSREGGPVGLAVLSSESPPVPGQWGETDTSTPDKIIWPDTPYRYEDQVIQWVGAHNPRAQWMKLGCENPRNWDFLRHPMGKPPDTTYLIWRYDRPLPEGTRLLIEGDFPHARFFSIGVNSPSDTSFPVIGDGRGIQDVVIVDEDIIPDPGHFNPFVPGAYRQTPKRHYHVTVELQTGLPETLNRDAVIPPYRDSGNLRFGGPYSINESGVSGPYLWVRIVQPDRYDPFGGVEPPVIRIQFPGEDPVLAPVSRLMAVDEGVFLPRYSLQENPAQADGVSRKELEARAQQEQRARLELTQAGPVGRSSQEIHRIFSEGQTVRLFKVFQRPYYLGWLSRYGDEPWACTAWPNEYLGLYRLGPYQAAPLNSESVSGANVCASVLATSVNLKSLDEVVVIEGKAPTSPRTLSGNKLLGGGTQVRHWSVVFLAGSSADRKVPVISLTDEDIVLDREGKFKIVIGEAGHRPATAFPRFGVTWRPWPVGSTLDVVFQYVVTSPQVWENAPQRILWSDADYCFGDPAGTGAANRQLLKARMGAFCPQIRYVTKDMFEQKLNY